MDKYKIEKEYFWEFNGRKLYRIRALKRISTSYGYVICPGELGGYIENESNLSQEGNCWIDNTAKVFENAQITDNAYVGNEALVFGEAVVRDNAVVVGSARVFDRAKITENARVHDTAIVCDSAVLYENAEISTGSVVSGDVRVNVHGPFMHDFIANDTMPVPERKVPRKRDW